MAEILAFEGSVQARVVLATLEFHEFIVALCPRAEDVGTVSIRDGEPRTSTSTLAHLLSSDSSWFVQCCFTYTETVRTIRDIQDVHLDFHTAIEVCCSSPVLCCFTSTETVRTIRDIQDVHLDFYTAIEVCSSPLLCCFMSTCRSRTDY